jgi:2-dehydro-3-deoxyphosphogluconate aldolase/(4S)-4-hydroxy-2-oxoglutarate aldolase
MRLQVVSTWVNIGLIPLFYNADVETSVELAAACSRGGAKIIEFTNRGEAAYPVFAELVKQLAKKDPSVILGVGSIIDAPTAALYIAAGANFIVGPSFNPEIARLCNRRKILYVPGCATETEISTAEEFGVEICKIFPGETVGGPAFIKGVMAPCPWHRLMPTGGVDATEASVTEWIKAGAAAVGMGSKLIDAQLVKDKDYDGIAKKVAQCVGWVQKARGNSVFNGLEHIGIYAHKTTPDALSGWYEQAFDLNRKEGNNSYFVSGSGEGRIEFPKVSADAPVHLAIRVSDFEEAVSRLNAKGINLKDIAIKSDVKSGYLDTPDPEGNFIHLLWLSK